jgi:hypothetical protein
MFVFGPLIPNCPWRPDPQEKSSPEPPTAREKFLPQEIFVISVISYRSYYNASYKDTFFL